MTSKELAKLCNVSRGTVDRALNGRSGINDQTRNMILETAQRLGYKPNLLAQNLAKGRTMSLGVVTFDLNNIFFSQLLNNIESKARESGYFLYITLTDKDPEQEKECLTHLADRRVDGIILSSVCSQDGYSEFLKSLGVPVVTLLNKVCNSLPFIGMNDYNAMYDATNYVISNGYSRLVYVSPPLAKDGFENIYAQKQRYEGFLSSVKTHDNNVEHEVIGNKNYVEELMKYKFHTNSKTAIICSSDYFAVKVLHSFRTRGIRVPLDVGIMGFDSINILKMFEPSLSTVATNNEAMASLAVERIIDVIEKRDVPAETNIEYRIVPGQTIIQTNKVVGDSL